MDFLDLLTNETIEKLEPVYGKTQAMTLTETLTTDFVSRSTCGVILLRRHMDKAVFDHRAHISEYSQQAAPAWVTLELAVAKEEGTCQMTDAISRPDQWHSYRVQRWARSRHLCEVVPLLPE